MHPHGHSVEELRGIAAKFSVTMIHEGKQGKEEYVLAGPEIVHPYGPVDNPEGVGIERGAVFMFAVAKERNPEVLVTVEDYGDHYGVEVSRAAAGGLRIAYEGEHLAEWPAATQARKSEPGYVNLRVDK